MMAGNNSYTLPRMRRDPASKPTVRIVENPPQRRPLSLYDNLQQRGQSGSIGSAAVSVGNLAESAAAPPSAMDRSPSQANCLSTTVPQNIAATNIAGRHTPTRNSLRHSRMIVLSRTGGKGDSSVRFITFLCNPMLFAICTITLSGLCETYTVACRRGHASETVECAVCHHIFILWAGVKPSPLLLKPFIGLLYKPRMLMNVE
jgi:hypothetical protein